MAYNFDFTLRTFDLLLNNLLEKEYSIVPFADYLIREGIQKPLILRHDVDKLPLSSLYFAKLENEYGIRGTYYFRATGSYWDEEIIQKIYLLGHEIGYHYENLSLIAHRQKIKVRRQNKNDIEKSDQELAEMALESFSDNLQKLRKIVPVKTICMHGSPLSRWDNRLIWRYHDYREFGIIGEPYFDIDFAEILYLTDTGRRWDGDSFNVRDKPRGSELRAQGQSTSNKQPATSSTFHSTYDIIRAAQNRTLPDKLMMTFHPQRWTDNNALWLKELITQNTKNSVKYFLLKFS